MTGIVDTVGYPLLDLCVFFTSLYFIFAIFGHLVIPSCLLFVVIYIICWAIQKWQETKRVDSADKYVLITGCDTGFGNRFARLLDRKGFHVFATCLSNSSDGTQDLKEAGSQRMRVLQLDVTSDESVGECLQRVKAICGEKGLWAVVNNAGTAVNIDAEILDMETYHSICEVNTFGIVRVCKAFLPLVRKRKGRIVNVTSVRGLAAMPTSAAYVMSKFGAEGFTDSLRLEMKRFGVKVILVEPGMYGRETGQFSPANVERLRNCFENLIDKASDEVKSAYGEEYLATFPARITRGYPRCDDDKIRGVLEAIESAVSSVHPRIRYLAGSTNRWIDNSCLVVRLKRFLPVYLHDRVVFCRKPLPKEAFLSREK